MMFIPKSLAQSGMMVQDSSALQQAVADARSTELELKDLREKFGSLTAGANEAKDVAEKKATEAWLELAELREKCGSLRALVDAVKQQKDSAEKETSKVKVAKGRADTELEALRVQIGAIDLPRLILCVVQFNVGALGCCVTWREN